MSQDLDERLKSSTTKQKSMSTRCSEYLNRSVSSDNHTGPSTNLYNEHDGRQTNSINHHSARNNTVFNSDNDLKFEHLLNRIESNWTNNCNNQISADIQKLRRIKENSYSESGTPAEANDQNNKTRSKKSKEVGQSREAEDILH
jgi:hypothetical protein